MSNDNDFAGAFALLLGFGVAFLWVAMTSSAWFERQAERFDRWKAKKQRQVPEHRHKYQL